jgi:hypothetical protein
MRRTSWLDVIDEAARWLSARVPVSEDERLRLRLLVGAAGRSRMRPRARREHDLAVVKVADLEDGFCDCPFW